MQIIEAHGQALKVAQRESTAVRRQTVIRQTQERTQGLLEKKRFPIDLTVRDVAMSSLGQITSGKPEAEIWFYHAGNSLDFRDEMESAEFDEIRRKKPEAMLRYEFGYECNRITVSIDQARAVQINRGDRLILTGQVFLKEAGGVFPQPVKTFDYEGVPLVLAAFTWETKPPSR